MNVLADYVSRALRGLTRLLAVAVLGAVVLSLLLAGIAVALLSVLWSLLRGKRPAMFTVFQSFRQMSRQFGRGPAGSPQSGPAREPGGESTAGPGDVVDVQAREVRPQLPKPGGADRE